jgi:TolB-like protein/tetratricopeptide (TPR) repeat protein
MRHRATEFFEELRKRSVIRALIAYSVVAWMLLQVADVTFDRLPIPDNAMTVLIILVITGFPIVAIGAWGYEITHRGIVRHDETAGGAPRLAFLQYIAIVVAAAAVGGGVLYYLSQNFWEPSRRSIAVLPFVNNSAGEDAEYFSDGLTEEIQSLIVRLGEFRVVALSSTSQFKDTVMDVVTVADRLGAEVILQGSVRRFADQVSVTARLIDGSDGAELWSEKYDRELSDIFYIQEDIARHVTRALHVVLPVAAERRLKNLGTSNVDAYDAYLRGLDYLREPPDETTLLIAEEFLRESLAMDPKFAKAHAAMCHKHLKSYRFSRDASRFGGAEAACQKALEMDDDSAEVRTALGSLYLESGKYENAMHEFELALEENSNQADTYIGIAEVYGQLNQNNEAEEALRKAIDADVSYWASFNAMGNFLLAEGRYLEAAEFYQMYINRSDNDAEAYNNLGVAYYLAGEFRKAAEAWDEAIRIRPGRNAYSNTGTMYFYLGDFELAAERYAMAANLSPNDYVMWGNLADAYYFQEGFEQVSEVTYKRAISLAEATLEINPNDFETLSFMAYYNARMGERETALDLNGTAQESAPDTMYVHYNSALIHAQFGDTDKALDALERAVALDYQRELLELDPAFANLRGEERFKQLVK